MTIPKDIEAKITYLKTQEGGRSSPVFSGYRGQFYYNDKDWDAPQSFPDVAQAKPGETVRAYLGFLSPQEHFGNIHVGMKFLIREDIRTVATGVVTKIIDLERSAKNVQVKAT
jgi:translation elongation factor EF-Tu-like GTPase